MIYCLTGAVRPFWLPRLNILAFGREGITRQASRTPVHKARRPNRSRGLSPENPTAAQRWDRMTSARAGAFVMPVRNVPMSSSFTPAPVVRHPLSVSSACHHGPASDAAVVPNDDTDAGATLEDAFRSERGRLLHYLGRRAGTDHAPDLVQEVFVRAAGSRQAGVLANPAAFLTRIARNLLIDRSRRRQTSNIILFPLDEARDEAVQPDQEVAIQASDLQRVYEQAIDRLPEKTRRVFLLSRHENLTYRQISEQLGITVATVEYHMMRAIAVVTTVMEAHR